MTTKECVDCKEEFTINTIHSHRQIRCNPCRKSKRQKLIINMNKKYRQKPERKEADLQRFRRIHKPKEFRKEITNCVICDTDITDRPSKAKYCIGCSIMAKKHKYIDGKWINKRNFVRDIK